MPKTESIALLPKLTLCEVEDAGAPAHESWSPFCIKVHRALRAKALPYERRHAQRPSDHKAVNPTGQVPILLVGDEPITDSTAILRRIEQLAGAFPPDAAIARAEAWLWEELADTSLNGFLVAARWADDDNWAAARRAYFRGMPDAIAAQLRAGVLGNLVARDVWRAGPAACWDRFHRLLDDLEARAPDGGFWLGGDLSVADLGLFAQLHSFRTPLTVAQGDAVAARPRLSAWLDRVHAATWISSAAKRAA